MLELSRRFFSSNYWFFKLLIMYSWVVLRHYESDCSDGLFRRQIRDINWRFGFNDLQHLSCGGLLWQWSYKLHKLRCRHLPVLLGIIKLCGLCCR